MKQVTVVNVAIISAIGSATSTPINLSWNKLGNIYIKGTNKTTFLNNAKNKDIFACPKAKNVC